MAGEFAAQRTRHRFFFVQGMRQVAAVQRIRLVSWEFSHFALFGQILRQGQPHTQDTNALAQRHRGDAHRPQSSIQMCCALSVCRQVRVVLVRRCCALSSKCHRVGDMPDHGLIWAVGYLMSSPKKLVSIWLESR